MFILTCFVIVFACYMIGRSLSKQVEEQKKKSFEDALLDDSIVDEAPMKEIEVKVSEDDLADFLTAMSNKGIKILDVKTIEEDDDVEDEEEDEDDDGLVDYVSYKQDKQEVHVHMKDSNLTLSGNTTIEGDVVENGGTKIVK